MLSHIVFVPSKPCDISQNVLRCPDITLEMESQVHFIVLTTGNEINFRLFHAM